MICLKLHLKAKIKTPFGGFPEPPEVSGAAPCQTDIDCIEWVKVGMAKIEKKLKLAQNRSKCLEPEITIFEPNLDFKPHLLHPFDMEHKEKTAVKFSILRVEML